MALRGECQIQAPTSGCKVSWCPSQGVSPCQYQWWQKGHKKLGRVSNSCHISILKDGRVLYMVEVVCLTSVATRHPCYLIPNCNNLKGHDQPLTLITSHPNWTPFSDPEQRWFQLPRQRYGPKSGHRIHVSCLWFDIRSKRGLKL